MTSPKGSDGTIPAPDGSGRQVKLITADDVVAYLKAHPNFFADHADLGVQQVFGEALPRDARLVAEVRSAMRSLMDAMGDGVSGAADGDGLALDADVSRDRRFNPGHHPRQGRTTRAKQTRQTQHLAPVQFQTDIFGLVWAGDAGQFQQHLTPHGIATHDIGQAF